MKRFLSLMLAMILVFGTFAVLPVTAESADSTPANGTQELISKESEWQVLTFEDFEATAPEGWTELSYDDSSWTPMTAAICGMDYSDGHNHPSQTHTLVTTTHKTFLRQTFTVTDAASCVALNMEVTYDENPVVYINGTQVWSVSGYHDNGYVTVSLSEYKDLLVDGENVICAEFKNEIGGSMFDMSLTADFYDSAVKEDGSVVILSTKSYNAEGNEAYCPFGHIGAVENLYDEDAGSIWGWGEENISVVASFLEKVKVTEIYLQAKNEGTLGDSSDPHGEYTVSYLDDAGKWVEVCKIDALIDGVSTALEGVETTAIKVQVTAWYNDNWKSIAELSFKGEEIEQDGSDRPVVPEDSEVPVVDENGCVIITQVTCQGFYSFGEVNAPQNVLDGDNSTLCGSAWNAEVEQSITLRFAGVVDIDHVDLTCKNEGSPIDSDVWGSYDIYALNGDSETLIGSVNAYPAGESLYPDTVMTADGIKIVITAWYTSCWAGVADVWVYGTASTGTVEPEDPVDPECDHKGWDAVGVGHDATCTEDGLTEILICNGCGMQMGGEVIPATGHNFVNGICINENCGEIDPDVAFDGVVIEAMSLSNVMAGDIIEVPVVLSGNPGISFLALTPVYDNTVLTLLSATNGDVLSDMDEGVNLIFSANADSSVNGTLVTLTFQVAKEVLAGSYEVSLIFRECYNGDAEDVACTVNSAEIAVIDFLYGDVNDDRAVNGQDVVLLRKYMASYNYETGVSSVEVGEGADVNGDGVINGRDVIMLRKYMASYDYDTGCSDVVLGPTA